MRQAPQTVEKARCAFFSAEDLHRLPTRLKARRAANGVRKALLRKASEPTAHVAGFGTRVEGLRPSDTTHRVYRQAEEPECVRLLAFYPYFPLPALYFPSPKW